MKSRIAAATSRCMVSLRMSWCPPTILLENQRLYLLGVGRHGAHRGDRVGDAVHGQGGHRQRGQVLSEAVPCGVERTGQRRTVGVDERQRVVLERVEVERILGQPERIKVERAVGVQ